MRQFISRLNIVLRALMEIGIIVGVAYWGHHTGRTIVTKLVLTIGSPVLVFGFWGIIDFRQAGKFAELLRLIQELALSFLAAASVYAAGQRTCGWIIALLSIVQHILVYATGEKLLKAKPVRKTQR
jgi:Protein of unknown function (DUF2568)